MFVNHRSWLGAVAGYKTESVFCRNLAAIRLGRKFIMRHLLASFVLIVIFSACEHDTRKTVEGDLSSRVFDIARMFDLPESTLTRIETNVRTTNPDTLSGPDRKVYGLIKYMMDEDILRKPFIYLRQDNGEERTLYLDKSEYEQFKQFNWVDLSKEGKKVRVKAVVTELRYDTLLAYDATELISVRRLDGITYHRK